MLRSNKNLLSLKEVFKILLDQDDHDDIPEEDVSNLATELPEDDFGFFQEDLISIFNLQNWDI